jgi:hypothetical protein
LRTLGLREPRGSVCLGLGGRFLRASRFSRLRSALSLMFFVFTIRPSLSWDVEGLAGAPLRLAVRKLQAFSSAA